jgi:hypothetical protein
MKLFGKYAGIVFDNNDPKKMGRIKAYVPKAGFTIEGTGATDWALPLMSYNGSSFIPQINSKVWIEFEAGDPNCPIWTGIFYGAPAGQSELPSRARGIDDGTENLIGTDSFTTASGNTKTQPFRVFSPLYPNNNLIKTVNGILIEIDDTLGKERILIKHPAGTLIEIHADGKMVLKTGDNFWQTITNDLLSHILGNKYETVEVNWEEKALQRIIEATTIKLGKTATAKLILDNFGTLVYNIHTHSAPPGGGTTGIPSNLFNPLTDATQKVMGE